LFKVWDSTTEPEDDLTLPFLCAGLNTPLLRWWGPLRVRFPLNAAALSALPFLYHCLVLALQPQPQQSHGGADGEQFLHKPSFPFWACPRVALI